MPYIQNSAADRKEMLAAVGVQSLDDLFQAIPDSIRLKKPVDIAPGLTESEMMSDLEKRAAKNQHLGSRPSFLGGGMYRHHIPVVVDHLQSRSEFVTAYTPYQAEGSQGTLTAFYEFQTMIAELCGLEIANASMYDGFSAVAEAVAMASSVKNRKRVVLSRALHPFTRRVCHTYFKQLGLEWAEAPHDKGVTRWDEVVDEKTACVVVQNPNYLGAVENLEEASRAAHTHGALCIASVNPTALALLQAPGEAGVDIAVGDGQPLGVPLQYGGPSFGFFAARSEYVRKMPGRIVGETVDGHGKRGFVLTFQTREQHIRREKATSNICTNNALFALRGAIYLAAAGPEGLREVAEHCLQKAHYAQEKICSLPGYELAHPAPFFHEFAVRCPAGAERTIEALAAAGISAGIPLETDLPESQDCLLLAVTETNSREDIDRLVEVLGGVQ